MTYELGDIKEIRRKFNITQSELAKKSGVSQSLIAKIEAARIDPTYTKVKQIFSTLDNLSKKSEMKAEDIMNKKIITLASTDDVRAAIKKMKKYDISQMPVMDGNNAVGLITEAAIMNKMVDIDDPVKLVSLVVKDLMMDCPPIVPKNSNSSVVSSLLRHYPVVLISGDGKLAGLITKSDMLRKIYKSK